MVKKTGTKSTGKTAKKSSTAKTAKKAGAKDAVWESLAKELRLVIPKMDTEGLAFLVEQSRIHLYNMQVEELNKAAVAADAASSKARSVAAKSQGASKPKPSRGFSITGTDSGSSYYLNCPNDEIMFSRGEMVQLVKIANGKGTDFEIRERLYNWFDRERRDVFAALPKVNKHDDRFKIIAGLIKKNFKLG